MYITDTSKISFVCSLLTEKALEWATAVWREDGSTFPSFHMFLQWFREIFDHPVGEKNEEDQLLASCQGRNTAAEYVMSFRTLTTQTDRINSMLNCSFVKDSA